MSNNQNLYFFVLNFQEICQDPHLFVEGATRFDIQQGEIGKYSKDLNIKSLSIQINFFNSVM